MPLGTIDRNPPPFFKQGPSALSKLMVFSAIALFLMVADTRLRLAPPVRATVATVIYPLQWLVLQPVVALSHVAGYFQSLQGAQAGEEQARRKLAEQSVRANQVEQLALENERLRGLLELRGRLPTPTTAAEVLYDAADPYTRRVVLDKGMAHGIEPGSPVIDESGVLGQVTRVYPLVSEVTLLVDRNYVIPVMNVRTGARSVAYGDPSRGALQLRFMATSADVQPGDLLTTSGVDGVYPPGLPVATVQTVDRAAESNFARIMCAPVARVDGSRHVMVLQGLPAADLPPRPSPQEAVAPAAKKAGGKPAKGPAP